MANIRIIAYVRTNSGPCWFRLVMPFLKMADRDILFANDLQEAHYEKGVDIVIYNRKINPEQAEKLYELRKKYGFKIVVDVDDVWHLDRTHIAYQHYIDEDFAKHQINQIRNADMVFTTHERLAAYTAGFNPNVHVLPNAIPRTDQYNIVREESKLVRLFWQGSITHKEDIRIIQRPLESLGDISGKIKMILGGYVRYEEIQGVPKNKAELRDEREWNEIAAIYTAKGKHQYKLIAPEPVTNYYSMYRHADICLIPLVNSFFNRMKSNLKVLEAANLALPCIVSDVHPYKDLPVRYCKHPNDWVRNIKELVNDHNRRADEGMILADFINERFNFKKINLERKQILESAIKQTA